MGPENSTPVQLFYADPETGEKREITDRVTELSVINSIADHMTEGWEAMSVGFQCQHCEHADPKRTHNGKKRCKRWSRWVEPNGRNCEEYSYTLPVFLDPLEQAAMIEYFQRKQKG